MQHNADKQGKQGQQRKSPTVWNTHAADNGSQCVLIVESMGRDGVQKKHVHFNK